MNGKCFWLVLMIAAGARAGGLEELQRDGSFEGPYWWPVIGIHTVQLPNGEILHYSYPHRGMGFHSPMSAGSVYNPATQTLFMADCERNVFCGGHSILPDGNVLVTGGTFTHDPDRGLRDTHLFDPTMHTWTRIESMQHGRFYPTNVTLGDGRVLVLSGIDEDGNVNTQVEIYDPSSGWSLVPWANKKLELYPRAHLLTSGLVAVVGPSRDTETFDPASGRWRLVTQMHSPARFEGCSFLVPLHENRVMMVGGYGGGKHPSNRTTEVIEFRNVPPPRWERGPSPEFARVFANAVILADASVLLVGGQRVLNDQTTAVLPAEIYDPITDSWRTVASLHWPRLYHSSTGLLMDGRVIIAGGDNVQNVEFYSPPYMYKDRPRILSAPSTIQYGTRFSLECDRGAAGRVERVALIRLGGTTHSVAMDQRYVALDFVSAASGALLVSAPVLPNAAPPGFYMLVIVAENGAPSVARMINLS